MEQSISKVRLDPLDMKWFPSLHGLKVQSTENRMYSISPNDSIQPSPSVQNTSSKHLVVFKPLEGEVEVTGV